MLIYGLSTCAVCQRARKDMEAQGLEVAFRDVRDEPLSEDELAPLLMEFGDQLVDQKSSDYRSLNVWLKNAEADAQILAKPKVMARPIIRDGDILYLGWDDAVKQKVLAN